MTDEANPLDSFEQQVENAAAYLDVTPGSVERLKQPERVLSANLSVEMDDGSVELFDAYRSQHNGERGPHKGGVRYHPGVTRDEVVALSGWMSVKCAAVGLPYGGGKGGITLDPGEYSPAELERITRSYAVELHPLIGPDQDIPAPDVNTGQREMNWIKDTYETLENTTAPGAVTGKTVRNGGSEGRVAATGRSVMLSARELFDHLERDISGATVAIQGYGNAGSVAARFLDRVGADVVAVSDSAGGIHSPGGLDPSSVKQHKSESGQVTGFPGAEELTNEELLTLDVDLLVPAALGNAIDGKLASDLRADTIVEAANGPLTPAADTVLSERGVPVVPDILANAGGVTVSYFEWVQNRQRYSWSLSRVDEELEQVIVDGFDAMLAADEAQETPDYRTALYTVAIERLRDATENSGVWP